jgi:hypothetical protein
MGERDNSFSNGMVLNHVKLFLAEAIVRVTRVLDTLQWTRELVGERLGQCQALVI